MMEKTDLLRQIINCANFDFIYENEYFRAVKPPVRG